MFLFPVASKIYERLHPAVQFHSLPLDKTDYVFFVLGLLIYAWLLLTIFRPRLHATRYVPVFRAGAARDDSVVTLLRLRGRLERLLGILLFRRHRSAAERRQIAVLVGSQLLLLFVSRDFHLWKGW